MNTIRILPGTDKNQVPENFSYIDFKLGELYTIVGNTGSGKSRLIKDLEQLVNRDSISNRRVLIDGVIPSPDTRTSLCNRLIAHLGQNMRFVLDETVRDFLLLHGKCRGLANPDIPEILQVANEITPEPIAEHMRLTTLSGGQARALMIADISCICDSPVVLIDEIENAGINKTKALKRLLNSNKLVLMVTHDLHTALMAQKRIVMENGGVKAIVSRTKSEEALFRELDSTYEKQLTLQDTLRKGDNLL